MSGTPGTNLTATVAASLRGRTATISSTSDSSPAGFTANTTYTTPGSAIAPGGTVVATSGGTNNYNPSSTRLGQTGVINGDYTIASSTDPAIPITGGGSFEAYGPAAGLQYTAFGVWDLAPCANTASCTPAYAGTYGGAKLGVVLTSTMPTTGGATYTGGAVGYVVQPVAVNPTNVAQFYGTSSLTANFGTGGITGSITGINAYSVGNNSSGQTLLGTINNIGLTATISGSSYAGTTTVTGGAGTAFNIAGATGTVTGGFYGPAANETAGVFDLSGGANNTTLVGSFGAKQAAPSDRRLKQEIVPLGTLPNGLKLYSWRYLGGNRRFTGVMAQDLLADSRFAGAVDADARGLMQVDYAGIGFIPADFDEMLAEGKQALAVYRRTYH